MSDSSKHSFISENRISKTIYFNFKLHFLVWKVKKNNDAKNCTLTTNKWDNDKLTKYAMYKNLKNSEECIVQYLYLVRIFNIIDLFWFCYFKNSLL